MEGGKVDRREDSKVKRIEGTGKESVVSPVVFVQRAQLAAKVLMHLIRLHRLIRREKSNENSNLGYRETHQQLMTQLI